MTSHIIYEPIRDQFPAEITADDLHNLIEQLRPLLDSEPIKVIQIKDQ